MSDAPATPPPDFHAAQVLHAASRLEEAEIAYRQVLERDPSSIATLNNLGNVLLALGRAGEAEPLYRRVVERVPGLAAAHDNLGKALAALGRIEEAEGCLRHAIALEPDNAGRHNALGVIVAMLGRKEEIIPHFARALELEPAFAEAHVHMAKALRNLDRLAEAEVSLRRAIALEPTNATAHLYLANLLFVTGRIEEGEAGFRRAAALDPANSEALSGVAFILNYLPGKTPEEIFAAHRAYAATVKGPVGPTRHANVRDPERRLRIGYLSGDFRNHAVAVFSEPVIASHDRSRFEVFCYSSNVEADQVTERFKALAVHWRDAGKLDDAALCATIRRDAIDVLVDLSGHSQHNRLPVLARKPAPVQASWLGYLNTTGLDAIDYRITDARATPEGPLDALHSEKVWRLPDAWGCYRPLAGCPEVSPLPCLQGAAFTFAAFTNFSKVTLPMIDLWARVLAAVPGSRLMLVSAILDQVPEGYVDRFVRRGIGLDRIEFVGRRSLYEYFLLHHRADLVLDTTPFNGGATACHALWMGVPVVTLAGETATSRSSASLLHAAGLGELVAGTAERYLEIAAGLAADRPRLAQLRAGLRARMRASPLMDEARFTRNLEDAYREMWRRWCAQAG